MSGTEIRGHRKMLLSTHASFTLLRATLENAARALWLLGPTSRRERVHRCLRMHLADLKSQAAKAELLGQALEGYDKRQDRIKDLLRAAGVPESELSNGKLRMPGYGDIVHTAGALTSVGGVHAELFWSACSSLAHGDLTGTLTVLDREIMATDGNINWVRFTGSIEAALVITAETIDMTEAAFALYTTRARALY